MDAKLKSRLVFVAKLLVAVVLVGWLLRSGVLDMSALRLYFERPLLLVSALGLFLTGAVVGTTRFQLLLRIADVHAKWITIFKLQMVAFFFNTVIPGNIGGDVIKALYVARDAAPEKRTTIVLLTFVERLIGVSALVIMGALIATVRSSVLMADPLLRPIATAVIAIGSLTLVGGIAGLAVVRMTGAWLDRFTTGPSKISKLLNQLVSSARIVSSDPRRLTITLLVSMLYHAGAALLVTVIAETLLGNIPRAAVATVFPLGMLALMLPISPAGLGVGHMAFQRLFEAIGLPSGATVFNIYLFSQITPCLLGVFPFLSLRKEVNELQSP